MVLARKVLANIESLSASGKTFFFGNKGIHVDNLLALCAKSKTVEDFVKKVEGAIKELGWGELDSKTKRELRVFYKTYQNLSTLLGSK